LEVGRRPTGIISLHQRFLDRETISAVWNEPCFVFFIAIVFVFIIVFIGLIVVVFVGSLLSRNLAFTLAVGGNLPRARVPTPVLRASSIVPGHAAARDP
jgi:hypothetical protein